MRNPPLIITALIALAVGVVLLFARSMDSPGPAVADAGGMEAMSVDMDPATNPANTETSIGTRQDCARINENDTLDADEEVVEDSLEVDVTALNIPQANAMVSFSFTLQTKNAADTQIVADRLSVDMAGMSDDAYGDFFLLLANPGSNIFNSNDPLPDQDGIWTGSSLDIGPPSAAESGSGVLERMLISSVPGAPAGQYILKLVAPFHADGGGPPAKLPNAVNNGRVAIDSACSAVSTPTPTPGAPTPTPSATPTPTPSPTPCGTICTPTPTPTPTLPPTPTPTPCTGTACPSATPTPTPTPTATPSPFKKGNVDCSTDGDGVTSVDSLKILRTVVGLPVTQTEPCPDIGTVAIIQGDIDCNDQVTSVDALKILRYVAGLPTTLPQGCAEVGS